MDLKIYIDHEDISYKWLKQFYNFALLNNTNCYAFALGLMNPVSQTGNNYMPGFISDSVPSHHYYSYDEMKRCVVNDLIALNRKFEEVSFDTPIDENCYKIGLGYSLIDEDDPETYGFHFIKQTTEKEEAIWTEKMGWEYPLNNEDVIESFHDHFEETTFFRVGKMKQKKRYLS